MTCESSPAPCRSIARRNEYRDEESETDEHELKALTTINTKSMNSTINTEVKFAHKSVGALVTKHPLKPEYRGGESTIPLVE